MLWLGVDAHKRVHQALADRGDPEVVLAGGLDAVYLPGLPEPPSSVRAYSTQYFAQGMASSRALAIGCPVASQKP